MILNMYCMLVLLFIVRCATVSLHIRPSININRICFHLLFFIAFVLRVDPTLICLYISSFYFKQNFVVYEINFEYLIGFSVFSNISSNWSLFVFTFWVPCCDFRIQTMVGSFFTSTLFVRRLMSY
jgi:hypothetical protein